MPPKPTRHGGRAEVRAKNSSNPLPPSDAPRDANFIITVNTNYNARTDRDAQRVADDLSDSIEKVFSRADRWHSIIDFRDGAPRDFSKLLDVDVDWRPEVAPRTGFVHAHILLSISHKVPGKGIFISLPKLKAAIQAEATEPEVATRNLYLNIKGFKSRRAVSYYLNKGVTRENDPRLASFSLSGSLHDG